MKKHHAKNYAIALSVAALSACGGGGGDSASAGGGAGGGTVDTPPSSGGSPATFPASGIYALDVTAQGPTAAPQYGVSLVHPSAATVEYVIESPTSNVSDVVVVSSGNADAANAKINAIQPYTALYITAGDVRRVPLVANGSSALSRVQKAGSTGACRFVVKANDHANPERSRYIVSTKGADNACDTADDGQAEVLLTASGGLSVTAISDAKRLGVIRNPSTLAPIGWFAADGQVFWSPAVSVLRPTRNAVVINTHKSAVVETAGSLTVLDVVSTPGGGVAVAETPLDSVLTNGTGWQAIGFDPLYYFVYRNSATTPAASNWSVLRINRQTAAVTQLATGSGLLASASMGTNLLYVTEFGAAANRLLTVFKAVAGPALVVETSTTATQATVATSANGVHELWRRPASGSAGFTIDFINESGAKLLTIAGGYPLAQPAATSMDFATSENRTQYVFANGYGAAGFSGATLQTFDAAALNSIVLGTLPGASRYGTDLVFASVTDAPMSFMAGYAGRIVGGNLQAADAVAYSFDLRTAGSFRLTTTKQ